MPCLTLSTRLISFGVISVSFITWLGCEPSNYLKHEESETQASSDFAKNCALINIDAYKTQFENKVSFLFVGHNYPPRYPNHQMMQMMYNRQAMMYGRPPHPPHPRPPSQNKEH